MLYLENGPLVRSFHFIPGCRKRPSCYTFLMCFEDDGYDDDIDELFSIIPDVESNAADDGEKSEYEDLDDEEFDIDF